LIGLLLVGSCDL